MSLHHLTPLVYASIEMLPPLIRPALITRHLGLVLVLVDPRTLGRELIEWAAAHLSTDERNAYRGGLGLPRVGEELDPRLLDQPFSNVVTIPPWMHLPGRALVGGDARPRATDRRTREISLLREQWAAS